MIHTFSYYSSRPRDRLRIILKIKESMEVNKESLVADELHRMFLAGELQITVEEDINNISERLRNGDLSLDRLSGEDVFIKETVNEALRRVEQ